MKLNTSELVDTELGWAVAIAKGIEFEFDTYVGSDECDPMPLIIVNGRQWTPSSTWSQGGPIIEQEQISVWARGDEWAAESFIPNHQGHEETGPTALIAAMRCYVASKLGNEVDVPEKFLGGLNK